MLNLLAGVPYRILRFGSKHDRGAEIIEKAMAFKMTHVVERFRRQEGVPELQALELERELKRYLAMCAIYPRITFPMDGPVDKLWHVFLAHTADYRRFCDSVAGRMIHHWPAEGSNGRGARRADTEIFVRIYEELFGALPSSNIWPFVKGWRERHRDGVGFGGADGCSGGSGWSLKSWFSRDSGGADGGSDGGGGCGGGGGD
jgi:hypothetical protein